MKPLLAAIMLFAGQQVASGLKIELDYSYDTGGFFNQPGSRAALRAVADHFESILRDSLARIDSSQWPSGNTWRAMFYHPGRADSTVAEIPNLVVPADTLIVFAGGAPITGAIGVGGPGFYSATGSGGNAQAWFNLLAARGQPGALQNPPTDFGPWGGSISFNNNRTWNFSLTTNSSASNITNFVPVALHEIGHLLGIGICDSWETHISGSFFTGPQSIAAFGAPVPLQSGGGHWRDDGNCVLPNGHVDNHPNNVLSRSFGSFGVTHGTSQIALMDPSTCAAGNFLKVFTDLDLAGLRDIGWEVSPPLVLRPLALHPGTGPVAFSWPSTTGRHYRLERSTTLAAGSWNTLHTVAGDGRTLDFTDPLPPPGKAFYRLNTSPLQAAAQAASPGASQPLPAPASKHYPRLEGCGAGDASCCN
jgi:hypothetical protein